jgi:hypothetical protein
MPLLGVLLTKNNLRTKKGIGKNNFSTLFGLRSPHSAIFDQKVGTVFFEGSF